MVTIEVNYSEQELHLDYKRETGIYVDSVGVNLSNPYVKWLEEIAIKAKKTELTDQEIHRRVMEEISGQSEELLEVCDCSECHCGKTDPEFEKHLDHYMELKDKEKDLSIPEKFNEKFVRAVKQLANGETISKSLEELREMEGDSSQNRLGFNELNK